MISFQHAEWHYEPYPIAWLPAALDERSWRDLFARWPDKKYFMKNPELGSKLSFSGKDDPGNRKDPQRRRAADNYTRFTWQTGNPWRDFYKAIKAQTFIATALAESKAVHVHLPHKAKGLQSRFEFSQMPAKGGCILPHTDSPSKVITFVFPFEEEWDEEWGGQTEVLLPKEDKNRYNWMNRQGAFEDFETVQKMPFKPGGALMFIKTHNSWHGVRPIEGPEGKWRRTVTVNIELARK